MRPRSSKSLARRRYSRPVSESRQANDRCPVSAQAQSFGQTPLAKLSRSLIGKRGGKIDGSVRVGVAVVVDDQSALVAVAVRVREDILVYRAVGGEEVVEQEIAALGKQPAALEQRRDLAFVALDKQWSGFSS